MSLSLHPEILINDTSLQTFNDDTKILATSQLTRKLNLLKQLKITFESLIFNNNNTNSPTIWSNGIMIIFTKNILSILQDELIEQQQSTLKQNLSFQQLQIQQQQQQRSLSLSLPYNYSYKLKNSIKQMIPLVGNQLWSFILTTLKYSTNDADIKKTLNLLENEYNSNKNLNICLEWIILSLKSCNLLKQLKILYENRAYEFYQTYKTNAFLNDDLFLRDFLIYICAYETRDLNKLNEIQVFKLYNQQKRLSIVDTRYNTLAVSDERFSNASLSLTKTHRRLHSCPIINPNEFVNISQQELQNNDTMVSQQQQQQQAIFDLEINDTDLLIENAENQIKEVDENEQDDKEQIIKDDADIYENLNAIDYISAQQIYYERNLLDKENSHFLIADLAISSIELFKEKEPVETQMQQTSTIMRNYQQNIIEPIDLKKFYFKNLYDYANLDKSSMTNSSSSSTCDLNSLVVGTTTRLQPPQIVVESIDIGRQSIFSIDDVLLNCSDIPAITESPATTSRSSSPAQDDGFETIDFKDFNDDFTMFDLNQRQNQRERRFSWEYDLNDYQYTPESIVKNLFKKFNQQNMPKLSELKYLIESNDYLEFTQKFLDEKFYQQNQKQLTDSTVTLKPTQPQSQALIGDEKWAPVREQLIITNQKQKLNRLDTIKQQDYRCANCGIKIQADKIKQFRYCEYFSKYFCRCCHSKQQSYIPSYIIFNLDFKQSYLVSNKAKKFLDKIFYEPLFTLEDLNPDLFSLNGGSSSSSFKLNFNRIKYLRLKLVNCKRYITSCRLAIDLKKYLEENFSDFLYTDTRVYSIDCLYKFKKSNLYDQLKFILNKIIQHIFTCEICSQQGFICELCKNNRLIYPFDIDYVSKCPNCLTCYHKQCFKNPDQCLKCKRKKIRNNNSNYVSSPNSLSSSSSLQSSFSTNDTSN